MSVSLVPGSGRVQLLPDMQDTTARRRNDIIKCGKILYEQFIAAPGQMCKTRIRHGLPATGLGRRISDLTSSPFQQLQGGDTHLRIKLVYITGYEYSYFHIPTSFLPRM